MGRSKMETGVVLRSHPDLPLTHLEPEAPVGLVVVLTGYGKGKTTSALGMLLRSCGHGKRVVMIQFMKGDIHSGEWEAIQKLACDVMLIPSGMGFCGIQGNPFAHARHREAAQQALALAREKIASGECDVLILDEINNALHLKLVDLEQVLEIVRGKPSLMHLILTGRDAHPDVIALADTVSEVVEIKHAYRKDISPQPGIDY